MTAAAPAQLTGGVLVVDDHQLVSQSLTIALNSRGTAAARCPDVNPDAVLALAASMRPGLVLLDLDLGDDNDGIDLIADLRQLGCDVLVFTGSANRFRVCAAVAAGAVGWVSKTVSFDSLLGQVLNAAAGRPVHTASERQSLLVDYEQGRAERRKLEAALAQLTPREWTVLRRLADGLHADTVATELTVSVHTVRAQIRSIHTKLDVDSQLAAVAVVRRADELGLPNPLSSR
jgi:two-component system, NarL family, nitrate/nitrite response regulator NarL